MTLELPGPTRMISLLLLSAIGLSLCAGTITFLRAQQCANRAQFPLASALKNRTRDASGVVHITYGFSDPNISANAKAAILMAIGQWNSFTTSTKVKFELAPNGSVSDLEFHPSDDSNLTAGC